MGTGIIYVILPFIQVRSTVPSTLETFIYFIYLRNKEEQKTESGRSVSRSCLSPMILRGEEGHT